MVDKALAKVEADGDRQHLAEFPTRNGELLLAQTADGSTSTAENCFHQASEMGGKQGALFRSDGSSERPQLRRVRVWAIFVRLIQTRHDDPR